MDWRQLIIDHPWLAMVVVFPLVFAVAALKIGAVLMTGGQADAEDEDAPPEA